MTIFNAYNDIKKQLKNAGIEDNIFEAKQIIKHITGYSNEQILSGYQNELSGFQEINLQVIMKQRLNRYPLQYILGKWDFYGRPYKVGPGVLIPRPDTETVIEVCLDIIEKEKPSDVLDLCAGTGCIGITIACERKNSNVTLVEKYEEAARYIKENIKNADGNANVLIGDVFESIGADKKYDLIVSNPPYISEKDMGNLQPEVEFEPPTALYGGEDGLMFYRAIASNYRDSLKSGGSLVFEIGYDQGEAVKDILLALGFKNVKIKKDYSENDRVVFGTVE
ncbi:MAG: peptide chain release factor N(5)-glutamine methyltransferase [Clostridia bacterium]|nr:peptide chain release factor N(5)-glutamine methyltransferase [Clostridia bacterium]